MMQYMIYRLRYLLVVETGGWEDHLSLSFKLFFMCDHVLI
jgi:hypothetical protein